MGFMSLDTVIYSPEIEVQILRLERVDPGYVLVEGKAPSSPPVIISTVRYEGLYEFLKDNVKPGEKFLMVRQGDAVLLAYGPMNDGKLYRGKKRED